MINAVYSDSKAYSIIRHTLEENGIKVEIGNGLLKNDDLDADKIAILKPDEFYNTALMHNPPRSADGVVLVKDGNSFRVYVVELKSSDLPRINKDHVSEKFSTIFERFFKEDFSHIFVDVDCAIDAVNVWLVCDPYGLATKVRQGVLNEKSIKRCEPLLKEWQSSFKPYEYRSQRALVKVMLTPPVIDQGGHFEVPLSRS